MPGFENTAGLNVSNFYGPRETGGSVGLEHTTDSLHHLSISFTGASINSTFLPPVVVPRGAKFKRAILRVDEAFNLTGTSPTIIFGGANPVVNGIVLSESELESVGTKSPASVGTGTWWHLSTVGTTAAERVSRAFGGTSPAVSPTVGKATLILEFFHKTKG